MKKYYYLTNNTTLYQFKNFLNFKKNQVISIFKQSAAHDSHIYAEAHLSSQELFANLVVGVN